jgi:hypothetical protein
MWLMEKRNILAVGLFMVTWLGCVAQELMPVISLSAEEAIKVKQMAQGLQRTAAQYNDARGAWAKFYQSYQLTHPELPNLRFTADFRMAITLRNSPGAAVQEAAAATLTPEERRKAELLHNDVVSLAEAVEKAEKAWTDLQHQIVADHAPTASGNVAIVVLADGRSVRLPATWANGIAFTPDFRFAVPRLP